MIDLMPNGKLFSAEFANKVFALILSSLTSEIHSNEINGAKKFHKPPRVFRHFQEFEKTQNIINSKFV